MIRQKLTPLPLSDGHLSNGPAHSASNECRSIWVAAPSLTRTFFTCAAGVQIGAPVLFVGGETSFSQPYPTPSIAPPPPPSGTESGGGGGLSVGAQIGLGMGIPLIGVAIAVLAWLFPNPLRRGLDRARVAVVRSLGRGRGRGRSRQRRRPVNVPSGIPEEREGVDLGHYPAMAGALTPAPKPVKLG